MTARTIKTLLVANRGEIALRVMRTCREMGIRTVAVYSDADRDALHVRAAFAAVNIGPAPSAKSYLCADKIVQAALDTGADAIHPGFGFLSENAAFVRQVREAGLIFVGPSPEAMEAMGDKIEARRRMLAADVPVVPGTTEPAEDDATLVADAERIGYPVMIKASAGGGGKGIRIVHTPDELLPAAQRASSEAATAFGNGAVYLEKFLLEPRHIEVQIFGDSHGNVVHLGERECSIQRRHQKVVEERPSPLLNAELRERMGAMAVQAAKAIGYENAGTLEFLVDAERNFYMLEMNTRLQVEHPVTELTCGIDMVRWQMLVAQGEALPLSQDQITHDGHAIECRLYAEDADNGFLPATGRVTRLELPQGPGVRVDSGLFDGMQVGLHYDPMLAKISVHADDREHAIARMIRALAEVTITGVVTNLPFLRRVLESEAFRSGRYDTGTIESNPETFAPKVSEVREQQVAVIAAVMAHVLRRRRGFVDRSEGAPAGTPSAWVDAYRPGGSR
ncbi:MAG: biotin carboxylase [Planctomycetota bacterium]|nr:MAG: biotin carboxylase [Planctomycetota bacterium]